MCTLENMRDAEICFKAFENLLSSEQKNRLLVFIKELITWNRRMNLTGLSSDKRILDELVARFSHAAPLPSQRWRVP